MSLLALRGAAAPGSHAVDAALWRATGYAAAPAAVVPSGWAALDAQLPGGGWPSRAVCEILLAQPASVEWRLLAPALQQVTAGGGTVVAVAPPQPPYLPGLIPAGLDERRFVWVRADAPAQRLWAVEQLVKADAAGAVVAWLPQARPEHLRRLQVCAQACAGLVLLCRPQAAQHEASAAPLRLHAAPGPGWALRLRVLKRRGPPHEGVLQLPALPAGLRGLQLPEPPRSSHEEPADALGRAALVCSTPRRAA
jgi:protein ImuA